MKISLNTKINSVILGLFTIFFLIKGNFEFLAYTVVLGFLIFVLEKTDKKFNYLPLAKMGFSVWLLMHLLGGAAYLKGVRFYDLILLPLVGEPYNILKYDQLAHVLCYAVLTLFIYSAFVKLAKEKANKLAIAIIVVFAGMGLGAFYEVIEFSTTVMFASTGVGGYINNSLDLFFNFIGCLIAAFIGWKKY